MIHAGLEGSARLKMDELEDRLHEQLCVELEGAIQAGELEGVPDRRQLQLRIEHMLDREPLILTRGEQAMLAQAVLDRVAGLGPLEPLLRDPTITEIMVNDPDHVFIECDGRLQQVDVTFRDEAHLRHVIDRIVAPIGRRIDESSPLVDARLADGSRVNAIIPPLALKGPALTIRKFSAEPFSLERLIGLGTMSPEMAEFLEQSVRDRVSIIISGGTGSGKTSTLNALGLCVPFAERLVTIEDAAELQLKHPHLVSLEARPPNLEGKGEITIRMLVRNALRMRPDRIIVGEVRGGEAFDMLQAMNTGHRGSLTTLHANSPADAMVRLESMVLMAGLEMPVSAIRRMIGGAIQIVVQQDRMSDGRRVVTGVSRLIRDDEQGIRLDLVFDYDGRQQAHRTVSTP